MEVDIVYRKAKNKQIRIGGVQYPEDRTPKQMWTMTEKAAKRFFSEPVKVLGRRDDVAGMSYVWTDAAAIPSSPGFVGVDMELDPDEETQGVEVVMVAVEGGDVIRDDFENINDALEMIRNEFSGKKSRVASVTITPLEK
jgi:hypothetical protein